MSRGPILAQERLSQAHRRMLLVESGVNHDVVYERGYRTVRSRGDVPQEFKGYQRRAPGLLIPLHSPDGETMGCQLRPDRPRLGRNGRVVKYETPGGSRTLLDVHPSLRDAVGRPDVPLWITEGAKKGDALTSRGCCAISLVGVWNWQRGGEALPCWDHVALSGRRVYVAFDSDVTVKPQVQQALAPMVGYLKAHGAAVLVVYLPDAQGGGKLGVDDYLALGGTMRDLHDLARAFSPEEITRQRLNRDEKLRMAIDRLWERWRQMPVDTMGDLTARSIQRVLIEAAERHGKPYRGGVRVTISRRTIAEAAAVSTRAPSRAIPRLEGRGFLRRDNKGRKPDQAGAFVLLAGGARGSPQDGEGPRPRKEYRYPRQRGPHNSGDTCARTDTRGCAPGSCADGGNAAARVPELRWSGPATGLGGSGILRRLTKRRGAILEYVLESGGSVTIEELMARFARKGTRPRDFKRRNLTMLEDFRVVTVEGNRVDAAEGWLEAVEAARELGREQEEAEHQRAAHEQERAVFRERLKPERHPAPETQGTGNPPKRRSCYQAGCTCPRCAGPNEAVVGDQAAHTRAGDAPTTGSPQHKQHRTDWKSHPLGCDCEVCLSPLPVRFVRLQA